MFERVKKEFNKKRQSIINPEMLNAIALQNVSEKGQVLQSSVGMIFELVSTLTGVNRLNGSTNDFPNSISISKMAEIIRRRI